MIPTSVWAVEDIYVKLADKKCLPCGGGIPALTSSEYEGLLSELNGWEVLEGKKLKKRYKFKNFRGAMDMAKKVAEIAEAQNHHPDLLVRWGELGIEIWTHAIGGLSENDFILAAKIDQDCAPAKG